MLNLFCKIIPFIGVLLLLLLVLAALGIIHVGLLGSAVVLFIFAASYRGNKSKMKG